MSHGIPPNDSDRQDRPAEFEADRIHARDAANTDPGTNPYGAQRAAAPDLDANAPYLRSSEVQRLNRKAMLFLAGIVLLLIVAIVWMLKSVASNDKQQAKPREEAVVIPELPRTNANQAMSEDPLPISVAPDPALPPLPLAADVQPQPALPAFSMPASSQPTLLERRMLNGERNPNDARQSQQDPYVQAMLAGLPGMQPNTAQAASAAGSADVTSAQFINNPDALLVRGTYIRCVLETRIITDIPGFTSCIVTEPVYSINGRRLLLPKGSKVLGKYDFEPTGPRVAVVWDRITTPNGVDVSMASPGVDGLGGAGHPGQYSAHWGSRVASALLISMISDAFKYAAAEEGPRSSTVGAGGVVVQSPYESATARTMERLANQALDARRPATVVINQGSIVNVYVAKDVDFSNVIARL